MQKLANVSRHILVEIGDRGGESYCVECNVCMQLSCSWNFEPDILHPGYLLLGF